MIPQSGMLVTLLTSNNPCSAFRSDKTIFNILDRLVVKVKKNDATILKREEHAPVILEA